MVSGEIRAICPWELRIRRARAAFRHSVFIQFLSRLLRIIIMIFLRELFSSFSNQIKIGDFMSDWLVNFGTFFLVHPWKKKKKKSIYDHIKYNTALLIQISW